MRDGAVFIAVALASSACGSSEAKSKQEPPATERAPAPAPAPSAQHIDAVANRTAYLPAQCYAQTQVDGRVRNSCATCHQATREPNYVDDESVQSVLSIPRIAADNPWTNVLHPPAPAQLDDATLLSYVRADNTAGVDLRGCAFAPDPAGWDRDARGELTGWRAYAYAPLPGMFWPTNGSFGDAFIRLPDSFRRDASGAPSQDIYAINLAIVEAMIRRSDIAIPPTSEVLLGVDLDGNGKLGTARRVAYRWPNTQLHYVGGAAAEKLAAGLFPAGTELLHSLRYLDVDNGRVRPGKRMKELRYLKKLRWLTYAQLDIASKAEQREKEQNPDTTKKMLGDGITGVGTATGWIAQAMIERADGTLRAQTLEETGACIGCHGGVGANTDSTFSFARKTAWGVQEVRGMREPMRADGRGEYRAWLEAVRGGDDYASNAEIGALLDDAGRLAPARAKALAADISTLIIPSPQRAFALNRAYLGIVRAQSFAHGRDAIVGTPRVLPTLVQDGSTGVTEPIAPPRP
ncbi:MAG: hypothetical protein HOV81_10145 [Kofleriaceae bacterium]|nr:hypothetical protein [Kofleriaceae bacterium]